MKDILFWHKYCLIIIMGLTRFTDGIFVIFTLPIWQRFITLVTQFFKVYVHFTKYSTKFRDGCIIPFHQFTSHVIEYLCLISLRNTHDSMHEV